MTYRCSTQRKHDPLGWEAWSELWGVYEWLIGVSWWDCDLLTSRQGPPTTHKSVPRAMWDTEAALPTVRDLSYPRRGLQMCQPAAPQACLVFTLGLLW